MHKCLDLKKVYLTIVNNSDLTFCNVTLSFVIVGPNKSGNQAGGARTELGIIVQSVLKRILHTCNYCKKDNITILFFFIRLFIEDNLERFKSLSFYAAAKFFNLLSNDIQIEISFSSFRLAKISVGLLPGKVFSLLLY